MTPGYDFVMWSVLSVNFANRTLKTDIKSLLRSDIKVVVWMPVWTFVVYI